MPHYQNGTPAKIDDPVVCMTTHLGYPISGVVSNVLESPACNLIVAVAGTRREHRYNPETGIYEAYRSYPVLDYMTLTARECERADLCAERLRAEKDVAKRDELAGEVHDTIAESDKSDAIFDEHRELGG